MYLKDKKHPVCLRLDDETYNFFVECSLSQDTSLAELMRNLLTQIALEGGAYDKSTIIND